MSNGTWAKVTAKTAAEICRTCPLSEAAAKLLREDMQPRPFLDLLIDKQHYADAARFLAHTLPKRAAVWWACLCIRPEQGAVGLLQPRRPSKRRRPGLSTRAMRSAGPPMRPPRLLASVPRWD
jgi:hypothetical protein